MHWLLALDTSLFRFINGSLSNPICDAVMPWLSGNRLFVPLALLAAVLFIWRGRARALICVMMIVAVVGLGDTFVVNSIKKAVGRPRPFNSLPETRLLVGRSGSAGMPSSHSANWFAATLLLYLYSRRSAKFTVPLAVAVAFSRIYNGVHYPSDVVVGAIVGAGCATVLAITLEAAWRAVGRKWFPLWLEKLPSLLISRPAVATPSAITNPQSQIEQHWLRAGYVLIVVLALARWLYVASGAIELSEDEAYQWVWSKHPALSYYSKPPLIAYTQLLGTSLWGDNAFGVRFFSPLIAATLSFLLLRFFAREVSARTGFLLILVITATPLLAIGATLMTVDPLSVLFWTAAMLAGWRAIREDSKTSSWLWVGLWMGLGFLSKYTALFQWLCWVVFFALWPPARRQLRRPGPYLALAINLLCALPVIVWNSRHHWITVQHVADNGGLRNAWVPTSRFLVDFLGAEFLLLNPVFFAGSIIALIAMWRRERKDVRLVYFFAMGVPVFLCYLGLAFHSRVLPNWIAPAVLPMLAVMLIYWDARAREVARFVKPFLTTGLVFGFIFVALLHNTNLVEKIAGRALPPKPDPLTRVRAYREMANIVGEARRKFLAEGKPVFIIGNHYGITSLLNFYMPEARPGVKDAPLVYCQPSQEPENQYYFWPGYLDHHRGENALFVREMDGPKLVRGWFFKWLKGETNLLREQVENAPAPDWLAPQFDSVTNLGLREALYRGRIFHTIQIFECHNLH